MSLGVIKDKTYKESVLFSKRDLYVRLDDFVEGKENIILITGFSGSGKSVLALVMADMYKAEIIALDYFGWFISGKVTLEEIKEKAPCIYEFYEKNTDDWNEFTKEWTTNNEYQLIYRFMPFCFEWCKKRPKKKFIIEGLQIYEYFFLTGKVVPDYPIVIKGTSCVKAVYRALKRGELKVKNIPYHFRWVLRDNKWLNEFVKAIEDYYKENTESFDEEDYVTESYDLIQMENKEIIPMFFVTTFTYTRFGKVVRGVTNSTYSHSAMGFTPDLSELYSFNAGFDGLSKESIEGYLHDSPDAEIYVGMVLLKKKEYKKVVDKINEYIKNEDKTSYAFKNLFNMAINHPSSNKNQFSMVCSQFVDMVFKSINLDLSGKDSSLATPQDLRNSNNVRVYMVYEGLAKNYNAKRANQIIDSVQTNNIGMDKIIKLHKMLNTFRYGILNPDGSFNEEPSSEDFNSLYRYMSPNIFVRVKGGVCWDYAEYQYRELKKYGFEVMNYYMMLYKAITSDTHTFTVVKSRDSYIYLESSFYDIRGVYIAKNLNDIFSFISTAMMKKYPGKIYAYFVVPYEGYNNYGCDCVTFMNYMCSKQEIKNGMARYIPTMNMKTLMKVSESVEESKSRFVLESPVSNAGIKNIIFDFGSVLVENISSRLQVFSYTEDILKQLKSKGYKLYYLSNWDKKSFENFRRQGIFSYMKHFEGGIVSYEVGIEKPAKSIYEMLLEKYDLVAKECLFFDDKPENIEAATKLGIKGVVFDQSVVKDIVGMKAYNENSYDELLEREISSCKTEEEIEEVEKKLKSLSTEEIDEMLKQEESVVESVSDINQKCFDDMDHFVKWALMDDMRYLAIRMLKSPMVHTTKKKEKFLLLATISGDDKIKKTIIDDLNRNIHYNNQKADFKICYLPGDLFVYHVIPSSITESTEEDTFTESYIFSKDNLEINLDRWKPGTPLWITGTSGDGKSTLSYKMAKEYNAIVISIDYVLLRITKTKEKFELLCRKMGDIYDKNNLGLQLSINFVNMHPEYPRGLGNLITGTEADKIASKCFNEYFQYIMEEVKKNPQYKNRWIIVEGSNICYMDIDVLIQQPLIILGCSRLRAFIQRYKRERNNENDGFRTNDNLSAIGTIMKLIRKYKDYGKDLDDKKERLWKDIQNKSNEVFFRITYEGIGIYEALRNNVSFDTWKQILISDSISWLPKPPEYTTGFLSYFTKTGYEMFKTKTLPVIEKYLNKDKIKTEKVSGTKNVIYRDEYQVVVDSRKDKIRNTKIPFSQEEKSFLNCLDGPSVFKESTETQREKILNLVLQKLEEKGAKPKVSKADKMGWITKNDSGQFGPSLCIAGLGNEGLNQLCSDVNIVIKDKGGRLSPDNYGTAFLTVKESGEDDLYEESYVGNYFRNKVLLKRFAQRPEINRKLCIEAIENLEKNFKRLEKSKSVKEIKDKEDVGSYFFPTSSLTFPDKMKITFAFCFDYSSFTPGAACYTSEMGYVVVIYPGYFEENMEARIFILLHEIGHIRLHHTDKGNQSWWDPNRRVRVMKKGKVIYPEANADLYAVLNGSKMYTILQAGVSNDYDKDYDYRFTNSEMAQRYAKVLKNYGKLKGFGREHLEESCHDFVLESDSSHKKTYIIEKEYGIMGPNGAYNACVKVKGINKPLRGRSELLIIKGDSVFIKFKDGGKYDLPGGGWEKDEGHKTAAFREAMEESRIECKNVEYLDTYVEVFDEPKPWVKDKFDRKDWWYGYYTEVYVGEYDKKYTGHIDDIDKDDGMLKKGRFYPIKDVYHKLKDVHQEALASYIKIKEKDIALESASEDAEELQPVGLDEWDIFESFFESVEANSYIIRDEIYPTIAEVLSTPAGDKMYRRAIESFVDRNTERLHEVCPISMIAFTDADKAKFFDIFGLDQRQVIKTIEKALTAISGNAQFRLVKQNPIFTVFYCALRYYTLKNDQTGINSTLIIHALSSYPSIFSKYFQYGANASIMQYTADHLTEKFIFKQEGHVFGALRKSIESGYQFLKPFIKDGSDKEVVRFIQRVRNDQNSIMKKIKNEYNKNRASGKYTTTQIETFDNGALVDDFSNDTSQVETISQKVIINILTNGIDLKALETAANIAQLSVVELRYYLTKIMVDSRSAELDSFINSVLFIYLFDEKHKKDEIRSKVFIGFGIELFRRTNSNNKNVVVIKDLLNKWSEETGIHTKFKREATRIAYKKGIYWYIMLSIQMMS